MANSLLPLSIVTVATLFGDYLIKKATLESNGLLSLSFIGAAALYGLVAVGWFFMMKSNSLAMIGVIYSASTILLLAALGYFVFKEQFGLRETLGVSLAIMSVAVMRL